MAAASIFDIDGTLVTFKFDVQGTRKELIAELSRRGYDTAGLGLTTPTQAILDVARAQTPGSRDKDYEEARRAVFSILDVLETKSAASTAPFPGTREALDGLKSKGVRLAVLTNSGRRAASESLGRAGLLDLFEFVMTRDDTLVMKPRPEGLAMAAAALGLPRTSIYYVGDSPFDIAAARGAGVRSVAVATGSYSAERLRAEGPDAVIPSLSELSAVLGV